MHHPLLTLAAIAATTVLGVTLIPGGDAPLVPPAPKIAPAGPSKHGARLEDPVTLHLRHHTWSEAMGALNTVTWLRIGALPSPIPKQYTVSGDWIQQPLRRVLDHIATAGDMTWELVDDRVLFHHLRPDNRAWISWLDRLPDRDDGKLHLEPECHFDTFPTVDADLRAALDRTALRLDPLTCPPRTVLVMTRCQHPWALSAIRRILTTAVHAASPNLASRRHFAVDMLRDVGCAEDLPTLERLLEDPQVGGVALRSLLLIHRRLTLNPERFIDHLTARFQDITTQVPHRIQIFLAMGLGSSTFGPILAQAIQKPPLSADGVWRFGLDARTCTQAWLSWLAVDRSAAREFLRARLGQAAWPADQLELFALVGACQSLRDPALAPLLLNLWGRLPVQDPQAMNLMEPLLQAVGAQCDPATDALVRTTQPKGLLTQARIDELAWRLRLPELEQELVTTAEGRPANERVRNLLARYRQLPALLRGYNSPATVAEADRITTPTGSGKPVPQSPRPVEDPGF